MKNYEADLEKQAQHYANKAPQSLGDVRELLILAAATCCVTAHRYFEDRLGDPIMLSHLISTIRDADDFCSGDARIEAAYYLGKFSPDLLRSHSNALLALYDRESDELPGGCLRGLLSQSLAAAHIPGGRDRIVRDLNREGYDKEAFLKAICAYDAT